jgi:hypothetical protein
MAATGLATSAVASATQGAFDNAYIPAVYLGALLGAACVVELPALTAGLSKLPPPRMIGFLGLAVLSAHVLIRWTDPSPHVPTPQDRAEARRLLDYLVQQGPQVFVPCHPFYNVLAGGRGHLHVMGINDVYYWPGSITSDPAADAAIKRRFRQSIKQSFDERRWTMVIDDHAFTPQLFGLPEDYRLVDDLALSGKVPRTLTGYQCVSRQVWLPR